MGNSRRREIKDGEEELSKEEIEKVLGKLKTERRLMEFRTRCGSMEEGE